MEIKVLCPNCQKQLKAPQEMAGKKAQCPSCKTLMLIPDIVHAAEEVEVQPPPPPPLSNLSDLLNEEDEYRLASGPTVTVNTPEQPRRPCPMCGEMIAVGAAKCRYCDAIFDDKLRLAEKKKNKRSGSSSTDSELSAGDIAVAILCSGIGCIAGIVWLIQGKPKGGKMIGISILCAFLWNILGAIINAIQHGNVQP